MKICKGQPKQNTVVTVSFLPVIPPEITSLSQLHESIVNTFVLANIFFSQIDNPIFKQLFLNLGVEDSNIPNSKNLRSLVMELSEIKNQETIQTFENKMVLLIIEKTKSRNLSLYQISIYHLGLLRHLTLIKFDNPTAKKY